MAIPLSRYFALLGRYLRPHRGQFALLAVFLLGGIALQIVIPQVTRRVIDTATRAATESSLETVTLAAVTFIGLGIFQQVVALTAVYFGEQVAWSATNALRIDLFAHVVRLGLGFHNQTKPGALIERIDGDISLLAEFFSQFFIRILGSLLLTLGILIALMIEDGRSGIVFGIFALCAVGLLYRVRRVAVEPQKRVRAAYSELAGFIEERLAGVEDIKANGAVGFVMDGLLALHRQIGALWSRAVFTQSIFQWVSGMIVAVGYSVAFLVSYGLYEGGTLTVGGVYLLVNYMNLLNRPLTDLSQQIERLQNISASLERVEALMGTPPGLAEAHPTESLAIPAGALAVTFESVGFAYPNGATEEPASVLSGVSFTLAAGELLGIVGRTGSGKTTLARLLFRLYDVEAGSIRLNGVDIRRVPLSDVRGRMALVTQDVQLFEGTIRDNLTFYDLTVPDEAIRAALAGLELDDWLRELPAGLDTMIGAGGRGLSAGQGQLLAFGRAMLRQPDLVILDEASSRLDPATEARIERAVGRLLTGRTGIIIAHRLATLERVDKILMMEQGQVIETGARAALAADSASRYRHLLAVGMGG